MEFQDKIIRATGKKTPFRLIVTDLTSTMNSIGKAHNAEGYALKLLAENSIGSIFLSASLKFPGTVSVITRFSGEISLVQSDSTPQGLVRAMIPQNELLEIKGNEPALIPQNIQVIKINEQGKRVHESIIKAPSVSMGQNLATYLLQSEQIRSAVGIEASFNKSNPKVLDYAVGFYIEAFPDLEEKDITLIEVIIQNLPKFSDLYKEGKFDLNELIEQLRGPYEIDIVKEITPEPYCPCSKERTLSTLATLPLTDLQELEQEGKDLEVICDFCRSPYQITHVDLRGLIQKHNKDI